MGPKKKAAASRGKKHAAPEKKNGNGKVAEKLRDTDEAAEAVASHQKDEPEFSEEEEESEDDDLVLEGVVVRNPDVSSSSSSSEEEEDSKNEKPASKRKSDDDDDAKQATLPKQKKQKKKKKKSPDDEQQPEMVQVEFTFCDMDEKFFHGLKTLLHSSSSIYAPQSSALTDLMIENISVGTVISSEQGGEEGSVFAFASVLNVTTNGTAPCIQYLKKLCLDHCPKEREAEMNTVLSGKTRRPAGFLIHSRMINLPLELVEELHSQLVLDMEWAVKHAEGGKEEQASLDFGAFVRLAPSYKGGSGSIDYKYFDDEILASHAEFVYTIDAPKSFGASEKQLCSIIVITRTGHQDAMKELKQLVRGSSR